MEKDFFRYGRAFFYATSLFFRSFKILKHKSIKFWLSTKRDVQVEVDGNKFLVRSGNLANKISDIYMIFECVADKQYNPAGFEIKDNYTIIDIGGHIGAFSVYAARLDKNGKVYSYEPDIYNFSQLEKNVKLNGLKNIKIFNKAVSDRLGKVKLYRDKLNPAENTMYRKSNTFSIVNSVPLEEIFLSNKITSCDFLKMDTEGAEYDIILNTPKNILGKIGKIACEYHNIKDRSSGILEKFLVENGYKIRTMKANNYRGIIYASR